MLPRYEAVPYHNCLHGLDCMQSLHATLCKSPKYEAALAVDDENDHTLLVVLLAALAHDVGHPGFTNAYLVETSHDFAIKYNDQSVLENHSAAVAFRILKEPAFNFLGGLSRDYYYRLSTHCC